MSYYNFLAGNSKLHTLKKILVGFGKFAIIFGLSFAISFSLIYSSQYNSENKVSELKKEIQELESTNKELSETVDSLNIQIDNYKKAAEEAKKAEANQQAQTEMTNDEDADSTETSEEVGGDLSEQASPEQE